MKFASPHRIAQVPDRTAQHGSSCGADGAIASAVIYSTKIVRNLKREGDSHVNGPMIPPARSLTSSRAKAISAQVVAFKLQRARVYLVWFREMIYGGKYSTKSLSFKFKRSEYFERVI